MLKSPYAIDLGQLLIKTIYLHSFWQ